MTRGTITSKKTITIEKAIQSRKAITTGKMMKSVAVITAAALTLSMAACGKGGAADGNGAGNNAGGTKDTARPEYSYVAEYVDLGIEEDADFYRTQFVGDNMYYISQHWDEETGESTQTLHVYSLEDKKDVGSLVLSENENTEETRIYHSVDNYAVCSDGSIAMIENVYDGTDEMNPKHSYTLSLYDADFQKTGEADLKEAIKAEDDDFYINRFQCDADDRFYVIADSKIYLFDKDLSFKGNVDAGDSWINMSGRGKDGSIYVGMYDQGSNGYVVRQVDFDRKQLGEQHTGFISGNGESMTAGLEGDFLVSDGTKVYEYSMAENKATELFAWLDCDIFGDYVQNMFVTEDGRIAVTIRDWSNDETSLAYLSKVKTEELAPKTQITLGAFYAQQDIQAAAVAFNKQSNNYHVNIKYYLDMTDMNEDSWQNALTAMNNELASADAPDMVALSTGGVNVTSLAAKGVFEDLNDYLAKSSKLDREDYLENVLRAGTYSDCLVYIPKRFSVQTLVGKTKNVGDGNSWSLDDIMALSKKHPDAALFQYATKESMLRTLLYFNGDAFIDYGTGKCQFDSEEFRKILEFVSAFPDDYDWNEDGESLPSLLVQDKVLLEQVYLSGLEELQMYPAMFNEDVNFIGYPTTDGSTGCILNSEGGLAITSKAADKDGAWEFLEFYLTQESEMYAYGFPSSKKAMQELIDKELTVEYVKDENGELLLDEDGNPIPEDNHGGVGFDDWEYTYHNCTQEEIDQVQAVIAQAKAAATVDEQIMTMINEEAAPYFQKQKSVDEVVNVIQSRVQLYLNENQ